MTGAAARRGRPPAGGMRARRDDAAAVCRVEAVRRTARGSFTITGQGFGTTAGQVTLDGTSAANDLLERHPDRRDRARDTAAAGRSQLKVTRTDNGQSTVNGLTFHVLDSGGFAAFPAGATRSTTSTAAQPVPARRWAATGVERPVCSHPCFASRRALLRLTRTRPRSAASAATSTGAPAAPSARTRMPTSPSPRPSASGSSRSGGVLLKVGGSTSPTASSAPSTTRPPAAWSSLRRPSIAQTLAPVTRGNLQPCQLRQRGHSLGHARWPTAP